MKVRSRLMMLIHLDHHFSLMSAKAARLLLELFRMLDFHCKMCLNDIQFCRFMSFASDMNRHKIYRVFDMLDVDRSGEMDFDEFYLLTSILVAAKDGDEKRFIFHHSRTVFDLMDEDGSNCISAEEFGHFSFLFNFELKAVRRIFNEFDVSGDQELDFKEFRMFAMATIDKQMEMDERKRQKLAAKQLQHMTKTRPLLLCLAEFVRSIACSIAEGVTPAGVTSAGIPRIEVEEVNGDEWLNSQEPSAEGTDNKVLNDSTVAPKKRPFYVRVLSLFSIRPSTVTPADTSDGSKPEEGTDEKSVVVVQKKDV